MSLPWFRMYAEWAKDPKVQSMDETLQRRFVMLLCLKCSEELTNVSHDELACALRISSEELETTLDTFRRKGFLDESDNIANWEKRQFKSDTSAERVRRYREKRRCNVTETPPDTDTDTESEEEKKARANGARVPSRHIDSVFKHWQSEHGHPGAKCSEKRRRLIAARLKTYTLEELRQCVTGYKLSPFHRGDNAAGQRYDSLELMLRDEKHVEQGLQFFAEPPKGKGNGTGKSGSSTRHRDATAKLRQWAESGGT